MEAITLYQISEDQRRLNAMLEETGGELTPELDEALAITEQNFVSKAENYGKAILHYKQLVAAAKAETDRIKAIQKTCENAIARMEERLRDAMILFDKPKVEMATLKLSLRKSERVVIDDENNLPADCIVVKTEVSKTEVKRHLKAGETIGAHLEENQSLQIR
ncbi:MAG: siphovirus Gp157 family protein [Kiritimatiellae bacterium]|nr:siphovirus Gp157 family protein [Kiritimatiellia bacterium]